MKLRPPLVLLHRWFGLAVALFLFISGLTGAVISWDHELDAWLNPQLFHAASGEQLSRLGESQYLHVLPLLSLVTGPGVLSRAPPGHFHAAGRSGSVKSRRTPRQ